MTSLVVEATGPLALVEDLGRPGARRWGVAVSGAADRGSLLRANRLVGNDPGAAGVEVLLGGLAVEVDGPAVVAVTGAPVPVTVNGRAAAMDCALRVDAGATVALGAATHGLRCYLAVRGGIDVPEVLGSRSRDTLGSIGPAPLAPGDRLPIGDAARDAAWFERIPVRPLPEVTTVRVGPGPRADWIGHDGWARLLSTRWAAAADTDRVGVRLDGDPLPRRNGEIATEPMLPGAIQVPASGRPILLGPDAGTTGGYPVVAVVVEADLDLLAQLRPGSPLRLASLR